MTDDVLNSQDQVLLQTVYELMGQRGSWPTFTAVDLKADRDLGIEDAQAALVAISSRYVADPWEAHGYSDQDEVRLTLRGVAACQGGPGDLARLSEFVKWTVELEQNSSADPEKDLVASSLDFAAHLKLPLSSAGGDSVPPTSEVTHARELMGRLFVLADLLPQLWRGSNRQTVSPWQWQFSVNRRGTRPYRSVQGVEGLLAFLDGESTRRLPEPQVPRAAPKAGTDHPALPGAGDGELAVHLTLLRPEVVEVCAQLLRADRFDDAIFAAFRRLEHEVQQRIGSPAIGNELVSSAFKERKDGIRISDRERDADRLFELFAGAIGLFKGDRSHKDRPLLPCRSRRECLRILAHASSLLDLLDRDVDRAPAVRGYRHDQGTTLTLWVERAGSQVEVWLDEKRKLEKTSFQTGTLTVDVAGVPAGEHRIHLVDGTRQGPAHVVWITLAPGQTNWYRVVEVNIPLFADESGHRQLDLGGVRLATLEAGVPGERILATRETYQVGHYVSWHWAGSDHGIGSAWVRNRPGDPLRRLWEDNGVFDGQPVAPAHPERLMKISIEPSHLLLRGKGKTPLRVLGHFTDGTATWTSPIDDPQVESSNEKVAVFKGGAVFAKGPGRSVLRCLHDGCTAEASLEIAAHPTGTVTTFLSGLPPVAGVAWTPNGLMVSTRGQELWRVGSDGVYRLVAAVPSRLLRNLGSDSMAARADGELAVRLVDRPGILVLHHSSDYASSKLIRLPEGPAGTPMAFIWDGDDLIVAMFTGALKRVKMDGTFTLLGSVPGQPVAMSHAGDVLHVLCSPGQHGRNVLWEVQLETPDSDPLDLLEGQTLAGLNGVAWSSEGILLSDFANGKLLRLTDGRVRTLATGLRKPSQLTVADSGDIYVAEFGAGAVRRVMA
ncbi:TIGR02391 family protein [Kitasatospora sp. NPDC098652]|uniref:TIGR02391 family protein n=1 Tax=Kitasatospora sp. NPDC098652 TaxID=3364095 RepID=UPI0037FE43BE